MSDAREKLLEKQKAIEEVARIINSPGLLSEQAQKITPKQEETASAKATFDKLSEILKDSSKNPSEIYEIALFGSVAKDIHLAGKFDIDITMYLDAKSMSADEHSTIVQQWARVMAVVNTRIKRENNIFCEIDKNAEVDFEGKKGPARSLSFKYNGYDVDIVVGPAQIKPYHQHFQLFPYRNVMSGGLNRYVLDFMNRYCNETGRKLIRLAKWIKQVVFPSQGVELGNSPGLSSFFVEHVMLYVFHDWSGYCELSPWSPTEKPLRNDLTEDAMRDIITRFLRMLLQILSGECSIIWNHIGGYYHTSQLSPEVLLSPRGEPIVMNAVDPTNNLFVSGRLDKTSTQQNFKYIQLLLSKLGCEYPELKAFVPTKAGKVFHALEYSQVFSSTFQKEYFAHCTNTLVNPYQRKLPPADSVPLVKLIDQLYNATITVCTVADLDMPSQESSRDTPIFPQRVAVPVFKNAPSFEDLNWKIGLGDLLQLEEHAGQELCETININISSRIAADQILLGDFANGILRYVKCIETGYYSAIFWSEIIVATEKQILEYCQKTFSEPIEVQPKQSAAIMLAWVIYNQLSFGSEDNIELINKVPEDLTSNTFALLKANISMLRTPMERVTFPVESSKLWRNIFLDFINLVYSSAGKITQEIKDKYGSISAFPSAAIKESAVARIVAYKCCLQDDSVMLDVLKAETKHCFLYGSEMLNVNAHEKRYISCLLPELYMPLGNFDRYVKTAKWFAERRNTIPAAIKWMKEHKVTDDR